MRELADLQHEIDALRDEENKGVRSQHLTSNDIGGLDITRKIKGSGLRK